MIIKFDNLKFKFNFILSFFMNKINDDYLKFKIYINLFNHYILIQFYYQIKMIFNF